MIGLLLIMRQMLPVPLKRFAKISDPRNPKKLKHRPSVLMIYGILALVFQYSSRRAANREITRPWFEQNLRALFSELDYRPHLSAWSVAGAIACGLQTERLGLF